MASKGNTPASQAGAMEDPVVLQILANAPLLADIIRNAMSGNPTPSRSTGRTTGSSSTRARAVPTVEVDSDSDEHDGGDADPRAYNRDSIPSRSTGPSAIYCKPRSFRSLITPVMRARIDALGYVELSDLLPVGEIKSDEEFKLTQRGDGSLDIRPKKRRRILRDVTEWGMAFNRYASVLLETRPDLSVDLADYQAFIFSLARDYQPPNLAIAYDKEFRAEFAQSFVDFSEPHNRDLFSRIFHQAPITFCGLCRSRSHKTETCPTHRGPSFSGSSSAQRPWATGEPEGKMCRSWNSGSCTSKFGEGKCRYLHKCERCSGAHRARDCDERRRD